MQDIGTQMDEDKGMVPRHEQVEFCPQAPETESAREIQEQGIRAGGTGRGPRGNASEFAKQFEHYQIEGVSFAGPGGFTQGELSNHVAYFLGGRDK